MQTLKYASLLYQRAADDRTRYFGKSRYNFDSLHQSIHEFRVLDRSDQHIQEIEGAEPRAEPFNIGDDSLNLNIPLTDILTDLTHSAGEQGVWSQWLPALEDFDLILDQGGGSRPVAEAVSTVNRPVDGSRTSNAGQELSGVHAANAYDD